MHKLLPTALLALAIAQPLAAQTPTPGPVPNPVPIAQPTPLPAPPKIPARSYVLMDFASGRIIASRDPDMQVEPASITKLMTSYIAADWLRAGKLALDEEVVISEHAWRTGGAGTPGSTSFLKLGSKVKVEDLLRKHGISRNTLYRWRAKYGGLQVSDVRRMKQLEEENQRLKKMVANLMLDLEAVKAVLQKKW